MRKKLLFTALISCLLMTGCYTEATKTIDGIELLYNDVSNVTIPDINIVQQDTEASTAGDTEATTDSTESTTNQQGEESTGQDSTEATTTPSTVTDTNPNIDTPYIAPITNATLTMTIPCNNKQLNIDATVKSIESEYLNTYSYTTHYMSESDLQTFLKEIVGEEAYKTFDFSWVYRGKVDGEDAMLRTFESSIHFNIGYMCYKDQPYLGTMTATTAPGCTMTVTECRTLADSLMKKYNINNYSFKSATVNDQQSVYGENSRTGHYEYTYDYIVDGLKIFDLMDTQYETALVGLIDTKIRELDIRKVDYTNTGSHKYLTAEEATAKLISNIQLFSEENLGTITSIELTYAEDYTFSADGIWEAKKNSISPYWIFSTDKNLEGGYANFIVNAITGEVRLFLWN